jgi:hypothetical protein
MSTQVQKEIEQFTRGLLQDRLAQCSESQQEFFHRIYPEGVPTDKLENAIDLCDRTIKKKRNPQ